MKHLMLTTALATVTAFGAMAQTTSDTMSERGNAQNAVPAFLASDFTGKTLYTLDSDDARALGARGGAASDGTQANRDGRSGNDGDRMRWTGSDTFLAGRDSWQSVGDIQDIVMTMDGEIRGVLLDVGGFLGFGAYQVMVDIQELHFVSENGDQAGNIDDFFVVIAMSQDQLENLPEWDEDQLRAGFEMRADGQRGDSMRTYQQDAAAPRSQSGEAASSMQPRDDTGDRAAVFGDDHMMLEGEDRTADRLMGADVYDANGENIGSVNDIMLDGEGRISDVLVDVGGFLGMGSHTVRLPIEDAQIGWSDSNNEARVQVNMTGDQLEDMPAHDA